MVGTPEHIAIPFKMKSFKQSMQYRLSTQVGQRQHRMNNANDKRDCDKQIELIVKDSDRNKRKHILLT